MKQQINKATLVTDSNGKITSLQVRGQSYPYDECIYVPKAYWDDIPLSLLPIPDYHWISTVESEPSGAPLKIYFGVQRQDDGSAFVHFSCVVDVEKWTESLGVEEYMRLILGSIKSRKDVTDRSLKTDSAIAALWFDIELTANHLGEVRDKAEAVITQIVKKANARNNSLRKKRP